MRKQTTPKERHEFYVAHLQGESYASIAQRYQVSRECVRYWCRRQRDGGTCQSQYRRAPGGKLSQFDPLVRYVVLRLKLEHPRWGPGRLRYHLQKRPSLRFVGLPSESAIGRYLHQWPRFRRRRKQRPVRPQRPDPPTEVHQRWQIDFKTDIELAAGQQVALHTVCDPVGEVCIDALLHPVQVVKRRVNRVSVEAARTTLRHSFARWQTLPDEIQTDNEVTLVNSSPDEFPNLFTLWLAGLGIRHRFTRPGHPTDNAEIERCHRTVNDYAIVGNEQKSCPELQTILDCAVEELTYELPSNAEGCQGRPPIQAHPELMRPRRPFAPQLELDHFELTRVDAFLATHTWTRKVGKTGQICIGGHHRYYSVGRAFARRIVQVRFDPSDRHFVFSHPHDPKTEIGRRPARHLEVEDITGLATWPDGLVPQQLAFSYPKGVTFQ